MGLELVEIVVEVEETFGVVISDETAARLRTVGQVRDYILEHRRETRQQGCPSARVFRDVRRVLTGAASVPGGTIRPATQLTTILPPRVRRRVWKRLRQEVSGRLLGLRLPLRLGPIPAGGWFAAGAAGAAMIVPLVGWVHAAVLGGTATVVTLAVAYLVTRPFAVAFPHGLTSVGDVALAAMPPGFEAALTQPMADEEVWKALQKIVADVLGVRMASAWPALTR